MREIEIFYLTGCPYCNNARKAVAELLKEDPAYQALSLKWIEENEDIRGTSSTSAPPSRAMRPSRPISGRPSTGRWLHERGEAQIQMSGAGP